MAKLYDNAIEITGLMGDSTWRDKDLSGSPWNLPSGTAGIVIMAEVLATGSSSAVGVRNKGSSDEAYDGIGPNCTVCFFVGVDANRIFEYKIESTTWSKLWLLGYFDTADAVFFTNEVVTGVSASYVWEDKDLSANIPSEGLAAIFRLFKVLTTPIGLRAKGSAEDLYQYPSHHMGATVKLDVDRKCQVYGRTARAKFGLIGYFKTGAWKTSRTNISLSSVGVDTEIDLSGDALPEGVAGPIVFVHDTVGDYTYNYHLRKLGSTDTFYRSTSASMVWHPVKLGAGNKIVGKISNLALDFYVDGYFIIPPPAYEEVLITVNCLVEIIDTFVEEVLITIMSSVESFIDKEEVTIVIYGVIEYWDNWELPEVIVQAQIGYDLGEDGQVIARAGINSLIWYHQRETRVVELRAVIRAVMAEPSPPSVRGRDPAPNETDVKRNKKVGFFIVGQTLDQVDINTVKVAIEGVEYTKDDPEFSYTGYGDQYWIEVNHPLWGYEQIVDVKIEAQSMLDQVMTPVECHFHTEWESTYTRISDPRLELFKPGEYGLQILTIQENWVRQGEQRDTIELELWYGRYMYLPYVESVEMKMIAGTTNAKGKEVLDNGWFSVKVDQGSFVPMYQNTVLSLGPMFTHSKKSLFFRLAIPQGAATTGYFILQFQFTPKLIRVYSTFQYGLGIYLADTELINFHPNTVIYRAYVFNDEMWQGLIDTGVIVSPFYRGEDKQW